MESLTTTFDTLFTVSIPHEYYPDGCPYLRIEPDERTGRMMQKLKMVCRLTGSRMTVIGQRALLADTETPKEKKTTTKSKKEAPASSVPDADPGAGLPLQRLHFVFLLRFTDALFLDTTDLDITGFPGSVNYYDANLADLGHAVKRCSISDGLLRIDCSEMAPGTIEIRTVDDNLFLSKEITSHQPLFTVDLAGSERQVYKIIYNFGKGTKPREDLVYFNPAIKRNPVIGVIDIVPVLTQLSTGTESLNYELTFKKRLPNKIAS